MSPTLQTARTALTPWRDADADALLALFQTPSVRRYLLDDLLVDRDWMIDEIAASRGRFAAGGFGLWSAWAGGDLAGFAGFRPFFEPPRDQLLYGLAPGFVGRGLATEIAAAAIGAWRASGRGRVLASVDAPNAASSAVLGRLGFREIGREPGPHHPQIHYALDP